MSQGRPKRQPSRRNLELYHELVCVGRLQAEVASRFRLSQPRVAKIRGQVAEWVAETLPAEFARAIAAAIQIARPRAKLPEAGLHLHGAIALRRMQLQQAYGPFLDRFMDESAGLLAAIKAGALRRDEMDLLDDLNDSAISMAREMEDLAAVAERGPLRDLPDLALKVATAAPAAEPVLAT